MNYTMAYVLVILLVILGLIVVCFPRKRERYVKPTIVKIEYDRPRLPVPPGKGQS